MCWTTRAHEVVSLPAPAFDEPFTPVSVEDHRPLAVDAALTEMSAAGLELPAEILGLEPVDAIEYRSKSTDAENAALTVFRASIGDRSLVILGGDAEALREAARLIAP
jgi:hypothetical protein